MPPRSVDDDEDEAVRAKVPAVMRAFALLDVLSERGSRPTTVSELARRLDIPKSSTINLIGVLQSLGVVHRRDGGLVLGSHLVELGAGYLRSVDLVQEFRDLCREDETLADHTMQLAMLGSGFEVLYVSRRLGKQSVRLTSEVGLSIPANCTATGKAMLARLPDADIRARVPGHGQWRALTARSITDPQAFFEELARVRNRGFAIDDEEAAEGLCCVSAALSTRRGGRGDGLAAVSVSVSKPNATFERISALGAAVRRVAAELGHRVGSDPVWE
ncbi:IclR family transcriptional regulator [Dactylosporangium sp. NPDC051484]|uniref:IclR family transcriptional regulator n=1 Tax=Dactylosporangium sp. NPDC051484 TaxID=3154942 RepID=UPI00344D5805